MKPVVVRQASGRTPFLRGVIRVTVFMLALGFEALAWPSARALAQHAEPEVPAPETQPMPAAPASTNDATPDVAAPTTETPAPDTVAAEAPASETSTPETPSVDPNPSAPSAFGVPLSAVSAPEHGVQQLERELARVTAERADTTRSRPLIMLGVGASLVGVGASVAAAHTLACDTPECGVPPWSAFVILVGAAIASGGGVWLVIRNQDIADLESRKFQIERDLERLRFIREHPGVPRRAALTSPPQALSVTMRF